MKKSTQIISNPDYIKLIEEHNLTREKGKNFENDDEIRKRIFSSTNSSESYVPNGMNGKHSNNNTGNLVL
jgi:hypothetical protein